MALLAVVRGDLSRPDAVVTLGSRSGGVGLVSFGLATGLWASAGRGDRGSGWPVVNEALLPVWGSAGRKGA